MSEYAIEFEDEEYQVHETSLDDEGASIVRISHRGQQIVWAKVQFADRPFEIRLLIEGFWNGYHYIRNGKAEIHDLPADATK